MEKILSDKQKVTGTVTSNVVDLRNYKLNNEPLDTILKVEETFDNLSSLSVRIQCCKEADFNNPINIIECLFIPETLKTGDMSCIKFLPKTALNYVRVLYIVNGNNPTKGSISAFLTFKNNVKKALD